jgi:menaquinone-specific isochorismate synthase
LDLTAGAGLVRGSIAERELQEVGLKLAVLADQLVLGAMEQRPQDNNNTKKTLFRGTS